MKETAAPLCDALLSCMNFLLLTLLYDMQGPRKKILLALLPRSRRPMWSSKAIRFLGGGGWEVFFPLSNVGKKDAPQCKINWLLDIISTKSTVGCRNLFMISYYPDVFCMSLLKVTILYIPGKVDSESYSYYQQICLFIYSIS